MNNQELPIGQSQNYLKASCQGKNDWWRYSIGILVILFFYSIVGSVALVIILLANIQISAADLSNSVLLNDKLLSFLKIPSTPAYAAVNMPSLFGAIGLIATIVFIHQRKPTTMIRADRIIQWQRIFAGFLAWVSINCLFLGAGYVLSPQNYVFSFEKSWFLCLPIALVLTPIQTSFEELLFRGYFMQGMALILHNRIALVTINGILFMLPHLGNPELARGGLLAIYYFMFGAFLAALAIRDNGLELPLGIHAANNLLLLVVSSKDSALPIPSIWQLQNCDEPIITIGIGIVSFALAYYIFFGRAKSLKNL